MSKLDIVLFSVAGLFVVAGLLMTAFGILGSIDPEGRGNGFLWLMIGVPVAFFGIGMAGWRGMEAALRWFGVAALVALLMIATGPTAFAADGTVAIPYGDWITQGAQTVASICVAVLSWAVARWAPQWVRMQLTEQLLSRAVDYGIAVVADAAKGKVLEIPVANAVLREAANYAVANAPGTAKWLGASLRPKLIARLGAAGILPAHADDFNLEGSGPPA